MALASWPVAAHDSPGDVIHALSHRMELEGPTARLLAALGRHLDVRVYTLNPCREFWEDLETAGEARRRKKRDARFPGRREPRQLGLMGGDDPFGLTSAEENLPLRLWGRPGRENVRLLDELTEEGSEEAAGDQTGEGNAPAEGSATQTG